MTDQAAAAAAETPASASTTTQNSEAAGASAAAASANGAQPSWWESFTDETLKTSPNVTRYKTVEDAARALDLANKRLGVPPERLLKIPEKPDDAEGWGAVHKALGRPDKAEEYQIALGETATEADKQFVEGFREVAHKAGYTQPQIAAAVEYLNGVTIKAAEAAEAAQKAAAEQTAAALKKEWGDKFPVYQKEIGKLVLDNGGQELLDELNASGLGNSPSLSKFLAKLVDRMAEPGAAPGGGGNVNDGVMTPAQAKAARLALEADPEKGRALRDKNHTLHASVTEERNRYLKFENPQ